MINPYRIMCGGGLLLATVGAVSLTPVAARVSSAHPVVVELFTSEGCSSCPPADRVLDKLERQKSVAGTKIIALGEHVDYWDGPRWSDPFAAAKYTARQHAYAHAGGKSGVYTPQMVVDGKYTFVGSRPAVAREAIARAAQAPKAQLTLKRAGSNKVTIKVSGLPPVASGQSKDVLLAVAEDDLHSQITGGENGGRTLDYTAVVRALKRVGRIRGGARSVSSSFTATVPMKPAWTQRNVKLVALLEAHRSRRIIGAVAAPFTALWRE